MLCSNFESEISDNTNQIIGDRVALCEDGKYRWTYKMNLFKNPTVFLLIWKVFFFIIIGMFVFLTLVQSGNNHFWWDGFLFTATVFGYVLIGVTALVGLGYLLYAAICRRIFA